MEYIIPPLKVLVKNRRPTKRAPDAGDSAAISSSFHALAFFWLDGFAVPAPAQVTQTVGTPLQVLNTGLFTQVSFEDFSSCQTFYS